jgi:hypothetical protein
MSTECILSAADEARIYFAQLRVQDGLAPDMDTALAQVDEIKLQLLEKRKRVEQKVKGWDKPLDVFDNFREFMLLHEEPEEFIAAAWDAFVERGLIKPISLEVRS